MTPGPGCQLEGSHARAEERAGWARVSEGQVLGRMANGPGCGAAEEKERGERAGLLGCGERRGRSGPQERESGLGWEVGFGLG